jgi:hypothetical protein
VQDIRDGVQQVRDDATGIKAVLERMERERSHRNTTTQTVRVEGMGSLWNGIASGIALASALVCAAWVGSTLGSLRADVQAERQSRESMNNWTAQEVTAIRSYINNGRLQPMQPRPTSEESTK